MILVGLVVENRRDKRIYICIRRKRVVKLVIVRYVRLGKNQAEIRQKVVPPEF